jgi:hypothetical protein
MSDKLERINNLIEQLQSEIDQPIWSEDQRKGLIDAQGTLDDVKQSTQRTDFRYSKTGFNHVNPKNQ